MRTQFVLRLIVATVFATVAVIFSDLIPPIEGTSSIAVKIFVTVIAGVVGFIMFSDIATKVTTITLALFNSVVHRVSTEVLNQFLRLQKQPHPPFWTPTPHIGSVALTRPLILDTSAIIDGRVLDIAKARFLSGLVLIPQFILTELQQVADSSDDLKRARGRKGFEVVEELKKVKGIKVEIWDKDSSGKAVDDRLVKLAKNLNGKIITTDFNLNKVATLANVGVLNVNDLANAVKTIAIPGERINIKIVHLGKDPKQGVGYLADGTMVVVGDAADLIGKTVDVEVTKVLQIPAGRMIFAKQA